MKPKLIAILLVLLALSLLLLSTPLVAHKDIYSSGYGYGQAYIYTR